ncbi:MAG: sn-glycerol-1-phosphate dehydrogenase [Eubacteriales bacterium]|jgi:glycerol-1-phosphate dehydrogenase [NAD(P)+]|nr:sn-glycerol-1-phosphate dehydrogenase [Eubacteriales bacterium]
MSDFSTMTIQELLSHKANVCECGRDHASSLQYVKIAPGAICCLPDTLAALSVKRPFVVCDRNTYKAAGEKAISLLKEAGIDYRLFVYESTPRKMEPDEMAVGSLTMAFDTACDGIIAVGSGVINDCCKVLANKVKLPLSVVATAPSMDGYASSSSSMIRNHIKVSLYVECPHAILCDIDIMKDAPMEMLMAGLGDMLAKYIAICEWRISNLVTGEYYCENIANLMRSSVNKCWNMADRLMTRDPAAVAAVTEGLVLSGIAMSFANISRPASGLEHYFSHLWEMMALARGEECHLHGIQVGVGSVITLHLMDELRKVLPGREQAEKAMSAFSQEVWEEEMRAIFGAIAPAVIADEKTTLINDPLRHAQRLEKILANWPEILRMMEEELPATGEILSKMKALNMPHAPIDLGIDLDETRKAFIGSRVIRDKYLTSTLIWDLGLTQQFADLLKVTY